VKFIFITLFVFLWAGSASSREINYEDISKIVQENNGKVLAEQANIGREQSLTGSFKRSFIPDLNLFAGTEHFDSEGLGVHPTNFYGVTASINIFNGMRDYWKEKKRKQGVKLAEINSLVSLSSMVFQAQKAFLQAIQIRKVQSIYKGNLDRVSQIEQKVKGKVRGGIISKSQLTSLGLLRIGLREDMRKLSRDLAFVKANLKSKLGLQEDIEFSGSENLFNLTQFATKDLKKKKTSLISKRYKAQSNVYEKASKVESSSLLPSVDLYASYQRQPYSQRELEVDNDRLELRTGIVASWRLGEAIDKQSQAKSLDWKAKGAKRLSQYHQSEFENQIKALEEKKRLLKVSLNEINGEFKIGKNYYKQVSSEYLRGVRSTSDITAAFDRILVLERKKIDLAIDYKITEAQIEALAGDI